MYKITVYENINGEKIVKHTRTAKREADAKRFANSFKGLPNHETTIEKVKEREK